MSDTDQEASATTPSLRFVSYPADNGISLSAALPPDIPRRGIYVLEFDDGTAYAGRSTDVVRRFRDHARHQPGRIVAVRFAPVPVGDLGAAELATIQDLERGHAAGIGPAPRNVNLMGLPLVSPQLDVVIDRDTQNSWLGGDTTELVLGERINRGEGTEPQRQTMTQWRDDPDYPVIVKAMANYVAAVIPYPHLTERRFWISTFLPSGVIGNERRLAVLTVNNVEVLVGTVCWEPGEDDAWLVWFMNVSDDLDLPPSEKYDVEHYTGYGTVPSVRRVWTPGEPVELTPEVVRCARRLAMGLLRKGTSMQGRFHNPYFADDIFTTLRQHHLR